MLMHVTSQSIVLSCSSALTNKLPVSTLSVSVILVICKLTQVQRITCSKSCTKWGIYDLLQKHNLRHPGRSKRHWASVQLKHYRHFNEAMGEHDELYVCNVRF